MDSVVSWQSENVRSVRDTTGLRDASASKKHRNISKLCSLKNTYICKLEVHGPKLWTSSLRTSYPSSAQAVGAMHLARTHILYQIGVCSRQMGSKHYGPTDKQTRPKSVLRCASRLPEKISAASASKKEQTLHCTDIQPSNIQTCFLETVQHKTYFVATTSLPKMKLTCENTNLFNSMEKNVLFATKSYRFRGLMCSPPTLNLNSQT